VDRGLIMRVHPAAALVAAALNARVVASADADDRHKKEAEEDEEDSGPTFHPDSPAGSRRGSRERSGSAGSGTKQMNGHGHGNGLMNGHSVGMNGHGGMNGRTGSRELVAATPEKKLQERKGGGSGSGAGMLGFGLGLFPSSALELSPLPGSPAIGSPGAQDDSGVGLGSAAKLVLARTASDDAADSSEDVIFHV
jgi:hypothetical protein